MTEEYYATEECQTCGSQYDYSDQSPDHCKLGFCSRNCYENRPSKK